MDKRATAWYRRARAAAGSQQRAEAAGAAEARERTTARERRKRRRVTEQRDGPVTFRLLGADPVGLQHSGAWLRSITPASMPSARV